MESRWSVVLFDDGLQLVPTYWIHGSMCYWPTFTSNARYEKAVKNGETPCHDWPQYNMRVLGTYSSYEVGRRKLILAEEQSDLNTDAEFSKEARRQKKRKKMISSSEEESEASDAAGDCILEYPQPRKGSRRDSRQQIENFEKDQSQDILQSPRQSQYDTGIQPLNQIETATASSSRATLPLRELQTQALTPTTSVSRCSTPQFINTDEDFKSKLFKELSFIKIHLIKVSQRLSALEGNVNDAKKETDTTNNNEFEEIIKNQFPLQLEADLQNLERHLIENPDFKKFMVSYCSSFGGHKVEEVTKIILKKLLSNKLASNYSWLGAKKKMSFSGLQLAEVIFTTVKRNKSLAGATEKDVADAIKNWLRHATARYSNQCKKNQNQEVPPQQ